MKKSILIPIVLLVIAAIGTGAWFFTRQPEEVLPEPTPVKKRISEPVNQIPVSERPYLQIIPLADGHNIKLQVNNLKKPAGEMAYELEYQAGSLLQGVFGQLTLTNTPKTSDAILLGSCSAGGACTYHEDVKGGTLLARFSNQDDTYALKSDWKYIDGANSETKFSSKDAKFQLSSGNLTGRYLIILNSPGYPEDAPGEIVSEPYSLASSANLSGTAELTIRANEVGENLKIAGYDGSQWQLFESEVEDKMVSAQVELLPFYAVVSDS